MQAEYRQALSELQQARDNFSNADPEFVEVAILQLKAAELKFETVRKTIIKEGKLCLAERGILNIQLH